MLVTRIAALSINAPEWFARPDFQAWLTYPTASLESSSRATWHTPGTEPTEFSDTFITFDHGDGSDFDDLFPADIYQQICHICAAQGVSYGVLRLTNEAE